VFLHCNLAAGLTGKGSNATAWRDSPPECRVCTDGCYHFATQQRGT